MPTSLRSVRLRFFYIFRRIRNIYKWADVGIGPYGKVLRHTGENGSQGFRFLYFLFHFIRRRRR